MGVGDDVAVAIDDDPGSAGAFENRLSGGLPILVIRRCIAGHEDLDDAGADLLGKLLQRTRKVTEGGAD